MGADKDVSGLIFSTPNITSNLLTMKAKAVSQVKEKTKK